MKITLTDAAAFCVCIFAFLLGAANYPIQATFPISAPSHVLLVGSTCFLAAALLRHQQIDGGLLTGFFVLCCWLVLSVISFSAMGGRGSQLQIFMLIILWMELSNAINKANRSNLLLKIFVTQLFLQCIFVISQLRFLESGSGLRPNYDQNGLALITGSFNNPNDLACVAFASYIAITLFGMRLFSRWIILLSTAATTFIVFVTLSRMVLVLFFVYLGLLVTLRLKGRTRFLTGTAILLVMLGSYYLTTSNTDYLYRLSEKFSVISRSMDRLATLEEIAGDESISFRLNAHSFFLENLNKIGSGSQVEGDYQWFFQGANFDVRLMAKNPHSFVVENSLWLGYSGLLLSLVWLGVLMKPIWQLRELPILLRLFVPFSLFALTTVPSSVFGNAFFWAPWIFMCCRSRQLYREGAGNHRSLLLAPKYT